MTQENDFLAVAKKLSEKFQNWPIIISDQKFYLDNVTPIYDFRSVIRKNRIPFSLDLIERCAQLNHDDPENYALNIFWLGVGSPESLMGFMKYAGQIELPKEERGYRLINLRPHRPQLGVTKPASITTMSQTMVLLEKSGFKHLIGRDRENPFSVPPQFRSRCLKLDGEKLFLEDNCRQKKTAIYWEVKG